ncbi:hypothetical protein LXL04_027579 [Taraxacum kok-saghyz]
MESIRNRFFWGGSEDKRRITWIKWKAVLNTRQHGGLNIGSFKALNLALMVKWWWRFYSEDDNNIWKQVIKAIHGLNGGLISGTTVRYRGNVWGRISQIKDVLQDTGIDLVSLFTDSYDDLSRTSTRVQWSLEPDGKYSVSSLRNLIDTNTLVSSSMPTPWDSNVPIKVNIFLWKAMRDRLPTRDNLVHRGINLPNILCPLCNSAAETGRHVLETCSTTSEVIAKLHLWCPLIPPTMTAYEDWITTTLLPNGGTSKEKMLGVIVKAALWGIWNARNNCIFSNKVSTPNVIVRQVKVLAFDWIKTRVKEIPVATALTHRGILVQNVCCQLCDLAPECSKHLMVDCNFAKLVWGWIMTWCGIQQPQFSNVQDILDFGASWGNCPKKRKTLNAILFSTLWNIWRARNDKLFNKINASFSKTTDHIITQTYEWCKHRGDIDRSEAEWYCNPF